MTRLSLWHWKAINTQGRCQKGVMLAADDRELIANLTQRALIFLSARRGILPFAQRRSTAEKIDVIRQLAVLLEAGMPLTTSLRLMASQHPTPLWSALLDHIGEQVVKGIAFSVALQAWPGIFPPLFIALLHTGELTGKLAECCQRLAGQQQQLLELKKKVIKALRYPLFILGTALVVISGMLIWVLPQFDGIYRAFNAPLPPLTEGLLILSGQLSDNGAYCCFALIALSSFTLFIHRRYRRFQQYVQRCLLHIPMIAPLWRGHILSQIFTVLSLSLQAGIPLLQGLAAAEKNISQSLWREQLSTVRREIYEGQPFWQALDNKPGFTPLCRQWVRIGEESGSLDIMLARLAHWHQQQTGDLAEKLAARLEPVMMLITGGLVGTVVLAMYLPILQMGEVLL